MAVSTVNLVVTPIYWQPSGYTYPTGYQNVISST